MPVNRVAEDPSTLIVDEDFNLDERPQGSQAAAPTSISSGWGDIEPKPTGDYPVDFKHSDQILVIKFLDQNGPALMYKQHFLTTKPGKKSYVCLENHPNGCPLCELPSSIPGQRSEDKRGFSIVNLSADSMQRQLLTATPKLYRTLHTFDHSPQGPLPSKFWGISKQGERQSTNYALIAIKPRDLMEDWNINVEEAEAFIATVKPFDTSVLRETSYADLEEIAISLS